MWLSGLCLFMGVAYSPWSNIPAKLPLGLEVVTGFLPAATDHWNPVWLFGALWASAGVVGLGSILFRRSWETVFHAQIALCTYWTFSFLVAWFLGEPRAWVTSGFFAVYAGMAWSFTRVDPPFRSLWRRIRWTRS